MITLSLLLNPSLNSPAANMSHTSVVHDVPFTSEELLRKAALALKADGINCEIVAHEVPRMWFGDQFEKQYGNGATADLVLKLPDCRFDIGFVKENGKYLPVFDKHGGYIAAAIGSKKYEGFDSSKLTSHLRALTVEYNTALLKRTIAANGYTMTSKVQRNAKGHVFLTCTAPNR